MPEDSGVGVDVHARSTVAGVLGRGSGELRTLRVSPLTVGTVAWLGRLPRPVWVAYDAGPTGYGLARLRGGGIACVVAPPSSRAPGDRAKPDRRGVSRRPREGPPRFGAFARGRARRSVRARHRLSKLLLRHDELVCDAGAWTLAHDTRLPALREPGRSRSLSTSAAARSGRPRGAAKC
jgi:transposase